MNDDSRGPFAPPQRHGERIAHQGRGHALRHRPADHHTRVQIEHHGQVERAGGGGIVPELVEPARQGVDGGGPAEREPLRQLLQLHRRRR